MNRRGFLKNTAGIWVTINAPAIVTASNLMETHGGTFALFNAPKVYVKGAEFDRYKQLYTHQIITAINGTSKVVHWDSSRESMDKALIRQIVKQNITDPKQVKIIHGSPKEYQELLLASNNRYV